MHLFLITLLFGSVFTAPVFRGGEMCLEYLADKKLLKEQFMFIIILRQHVWLYYEP